jgi:hypothetical protein
MFQPIQSLKSSLSSISRAEVFKLLYSYRMNRGLDTKMNALTERVCIINGVNYLDDDILKS